MCCPERTGRLRYPLRPISVDRHGANGTHAEWHLDLVVASRKGGRVPHTKVPSLNRVDGEEPPSSAGSSRARLLPLILILLAGCLPYLNTLDNPFVFDDEDSIVLNLAIRDPSNFLPGRSGWTKHPTRVIGYLTFALNYRAGELDVFGYHALNIAIHVMNCLLVYAIGLLLRETPGYRRGPPSSVSKSLPLFAALLFAVHPVQTGAVTYVVQRLASLATLFYLGSFAAYLKGRLASTDAGAQGGRPFCWYLVSWTCALLAANTKEIAFTLPAIVLLAEWVFFDRKWRKALPVVIPFLLISLTIPLSILHLDQPLGKVLSDTAQASRLQTDIPRSAYLFTQFRVIATYMRLLLLPMGLNLDYDYPVYRDLLDPAALLSLLLILCLLGIAAFLLASPAFRNRPDFRLASFGILWFFIALSVESSVFPIRDVIFEHRLYLPSAGAFLALVSLSCMAMERIPARRREPWAAILAGIVLLCLSVGTIQRNRVWRDSVTLWEDVVRKSPGKARPHYNLGNAYSQRGRTDEAIEQYLQSVRLRPEYPEAWDNLGVDYAKKGLYPEAVKAHETAARIDTSFARPLFNLGRIYMTAYPNRTAEARDLFKKALALKPDYADAWINLAGASIRQGDYTEAVVAGERAVALAPERPDGHFNLAIAHFLLGDRQGAQRELAVVKALDSGMGSALERFLAASPP